MEKKKAGIIIGSILIVLVGVGIWGMNMPYPSGTIVKPSVAPARVQTDTFSYTGHQGKDALTLLKEKTSVEQDKSGLVSSINGRKADNAKKEFWAFYVNGTEAQVGPAQYVTKNGDTIEWKIEKY